MNKFIRIINDIPKISADQTVKRYIRGIKKYIRTEFSKKQYDQINQIISDALKVEAWNGAYITTAQYNRPQMEGKT